MTPVAGVTAGAGDRFVVLADGRATRGTDPTTGGTRDRAADRSGQWGLRTDSSGNVRRSVGGGTDPVARGYTAADW